MRFAGDRIEQAGAAAQRRLRAQQQRTAVTVVAADAQHPAVPALVTVAQARRQPTSQIVGAQPMRARRYAIQFARQTERGDRQHADPIERGAAAQPALGGDEFERALRAHRRRIRMAALGIDAARHVEREHRSRMRVDRIDQGRGGGIGRARQADAEQRVGDDVGLGQDPVEVDRAAAGLRIAGRGPLGERAARRMPGQAQHRHLAPGLLRMRRQHVTVAAVVAWAAHHQQPHRLRPMAEQFAPGGLAGPRHQRISVAELGRGRGFDCAQRGGVEQARRRHRR